MDKTKKALLIVGGAMAMNERLEMLKMSATTKDPKAERRFLMRQESSMRHKITKLGSMWIAEFKPRK